MKSQGFGITKAKVIIETTLITTKIVTPLDGSINDYFSISGSIILYTEPVFMTLILFSYIIRDIKETLNWSQAIKW